MFLSALVYVKASASVWSWLQSNWLDQGCSILWVALSGSLKSFLFITPISALCLPSALSTSSLTSAHTVTSCLTELQSLSFALRSPLQNKRTTSSLSSHSLFRWIKKPKQMPSITHIHSEINAVLCSSHKTPVPAGELHDGNWETYWNIHHITVCIWCYFICSVQGSEGMTYQWTNSASK